MRQKVIYTLSLVGLGALLARSFQLRLDVHPYVTWLMGFTFVTWATYGLDKRISEFAFLARRRLRVPELTLHLLALLGGFAGAWAGRAMFHHKINRKRHRVIWGILVLSTVGHLLFILRLLFGPPLVLWPPAEWLVIQVLSR